MYPFSLNRASIYRTPFVETNLDKTAFDNRNKPVFFFLFDTFNSRLKQTSKFVVQHENHATISRSCYFSFILDPKEKHDVSTSFG